jgi:hypothetical protein
MKPKRNTPFTGFIHKNDIDDVDQVKNLWVYVNNYELERFAALEKKYFPCSPKFINTNEILISSKINFNDFIPIQLILTDDNICKFKDPHTAQEIMAKNIRFTDENLSFNKYIPTSSSYDYPLSIYHIHSFFLLLSSLYLIHFVSQP